MNGIRVIKIVHPDLFRSCRRRAVTPRLGRSIANVQIKLRIDPILGTNPRTVLTMNMTRIQSQNSARPARPVKQKYFLVKMLMKLPLHRNAQPPAAAGIPVLSGLPELRRNLPQTACRPAVQPRFPDDPSGVLSLPLLKRFLSACLLNRTEKFNRAVERIRIGEHGYLGGDFPLFVQSERGAELIHR